MDQQYQQPSLESIMRMLQQLQTELSDFKVQALSGQADGVVEEQPMDDAEVMMPGKVTTKGMFDDSGKQVGQMTRAVVEVPDGEEADELAEDAMSMIKKSVKGMR